ncbi:hypothetical protein EMCG_02789 [[Emmonsia] crescens]|uniref:Uncharacterized protein n=1 Tax=[Emmonsia] crescens TaxID=73230 RepID=A0A0G2HYG9_9EURO|nr:hypothetical protein EMCG_02789 [Emmonsia crescens UAMH 3008]
MGLIRYPLLAKCFTCNSRIPVNLPPNPGRNTTNTAYEASDIHNIVVWHGFNLNAVLQRHQNVLVQARLPQDPMLTSPPRAITAENTLRSKVSEYVFPRVRRALRAGFDRLTAINQINGLTLAGCEAWTVSE